MVRLSPDINFQQLPLHYVLPIISDHLKVTNIFPVFSLQVTGHGALLRSGKNREPKNSPSFPHDRATPPYTPGFASQRRPLAYIFLNKLPPVCLKSGDKSVFQDHVPEFSILCNLL
jgi:hypothetical protein